VRTGGREGGDVCVCVCWGGRISSTSVFIWPH
jgi:hypothetical protein